MFGLREEQITLLCKTFSRFPQIDRVKIFGSRALGHQRPNSDIDLAYWGSLSLHEHCALYEQLDQLPLPYLFDLKCYDHIKFEPLKRHINQEGLILYQKN